MRPFQDILLPILITVGYFASTYLLVSALLTPVIALILASGAALLAVLWLAWLRHIGMAEEGAPLIVLVYLPFVIVICGVMGWIVRLLLLG
jgi:hypothetical protein